MKRAAALAAALLLGACASSSPYRAASSPRASGFSEQVIEANRYRVQFRQGGRDAGQAQEFALLRAAELTLEKGYSTFEVVSRDAETTRAGQTSRADDFGPDYAVTRSCGLLSCTTSTRPVPSVHDSEITTQRSEVVVALEILMSDKDPSVSPSLYSASQVVANLRPKS